LARKVLLADDSVTAQNMGRRILSDAGYEVITVNNGSAALKKVADSRPDMIVLDVYMPGYGGLEVCQRLRESDDTARIPVLLTVGKLEPFKVEDVRRVRADAFIVKPFEASELLTALTKLEDRIVPQPQQRKGGRAPKPGGGLDDLLTREYGNTETGWKSRLSIPPPHLKSKPEVEESEPQQSSEKAQEATQAKIEAVLANESLATAAGLPADITADEIAAIQAAAASFTFPVELAAKLKSSGASAPTPEAKPADEEANAETKAETATAEVSPTSEAQPTTSSLSPGETVAAEAGPAISETKAAEPAPVVAESSPAAAAADATAEQSVAPPTEKLAEHEVAAVLASLQAVTGADAVDRSDEPLFATIAAATPREPVTGPRWMAASVPLTEDERSLILEEEMQKALATMAALQATEAAAAAAASHALEAVAASAPVEIWSTPVVSEPTEAKTEVPQEPAQPVEAVASESVPQPAAVEEQAAYAAAAAAGAAPGATTSPVDAVAPSSASETSPATIETADPQRESELAAAWASWKQVRDSVVSPQLASQVAESIAASASASETAVSDQPQASSSAEPAAAEAESAEPSSEGPDESAAIAGIVDTVLAELKPKLMQEIAKKMNKPKKQKK